MSKSQPPASTIPPQTQDGIHEKPPIDKGMSVASFDGSFAPLVRPTVRRTIPWYKDREYFLGGWTNPSIWKAAVVEAVATSCLVYVSLLTAATLFSYNTPQLGAYIGISNVVLLSIFIYATSPASGGHMNPMITFSAVLAGICPVSRGVLYLCAQTLGASLAGGVLTGVWGQEKAAAIHGGGCFFSPAITTPGQVFLNETFASFAILYLAYGVGLDPRQAVFFGPRLGPLLVGASLGLLTFASSGIAEGYGGAQMNPARCFAAGIVRKDMSYQWIWWFGPAAASVLLALFYNAIPPHHNEDEKLKQECRSQSAV
ncbi:aquaporin-like protein [Pochonia chlamydosporia 170]|uniref:Aquaporin-like protein n=1 Tax=Pochonia chlamydosporia 170 TaxID=1380566 RepID=A0A179FZT7_METCM|nr:aquaporin-like protein [Pochonia chlamydosporia 170]OAQ70563.1 aquaporin-like protein [Pochonia chlamydosporia 170]